MIRRVALPLLLLAIALLAAAPARADFGLNSLDMVFQNQDGTVATQAGSHPFAMTTTVRFNSKQGEELGFEIPAEDPRDIVIGQVPGFVGDPKAVPTCSAADFADPDGGCPVSSQVGVVDTEYQQPGFHEKLPVYSLTPPPGAAATLGWHISAAHVPITVDVRVSESPPYNLVASLTSIPNIVPVYNSVVSLWGVPAAAAHDSERNGPGCGNGCSVNLAPRPFLTMPRACKGPLTTTFAARSWVGSTFAAGILTHDESSPPSPLGMTGCGNLNFKPGIEANPTSKAASSPTGLDFALRLHDEGLTSPDAFAQSDIEKTVVTLPEGMTVNPSQAEGLMVCSAAQVARETASSRPGEGCPEASKIGTIEVETPLLEDEILKGSLFVATPYENPFGTLLALYVTIKDPTLGIAITQPLRVDPDPVTGRLTATAEKMPEIPFSDFRLHFREGARSPLSTPAVCGSQTVQAMLYPSAEGSPVTSNSTFEIITGPEGGPCPSGGTPPFKPGLLAGSINNAAGRYSPFNVRLSRTDAEQEITHFSIKLPPGVSGKLAGIPFCPETSIAAAKARERTPHGGQEELDSPSCPAASEIGRTLVGSGVGPSPVYVPGKVYLAGPYKGSALSIVAITAAKAGPFDLGTVVVREALRINPETAEVFVDAAGSDPIPHIIAGVPVRLRDIRVYVDRPEFVLNPTSCEPTSLASTVLGSGTDFGSEADDRPVTVTTRFQTADCASLGFKPNVRLTLSGPTKRAGLPKLKAVVTPRKGDANIGRAEVTLPPSEFLEQGHIGTTCTRVQFNAGGGNGEQCPAKSVYGRAVALTPLLSEPLTGPVFLRSNGGERQLPDLVAALHSKNVDINLLGFIGSLHKKGSDVSQIRTTFASVPDAPVSKFTLEMFGGKKGLLVNSTNLCKGTHRAISSFVGQNGKRSESTPAVKARCKGKGKKRAGSKRAKAAPKGASSGALLHRLGW